MFKKLKEKITEEVKSSPQRFAEFTQTVTDRLQSNTVPDDSLFSIGDDDPHNVSDNGVNASNSQGFSSVSLVSPSSQNSITRKNSNASIASDVSFLPRYDSGNTYHLQSDLDVSASELEDNASTTSSTLGHLSKEQIHSAFQKSQMRYHKYRGRYTDLARHYKELEREIAKMKSVLVETQDKSIRRVTELKEQCVLEQKAKAHLESALRDEIDEKNYKINTLQTKIELLQNENKSNQSVSVEDESKSEQLENLTKYLNDARKEIEALNEKNQELKANFIVFQSKEHEYKMKISNLEKEIGVFSEREKENNLKLAQNKMELHNELLSKDSEISNLKRDNEMLRQNLAAIEAETKGNGNVKLENLQTQNKKLIEKLETLTQRSSYLENEVLKVESYKFEIDNLNEKLQSYAEEAMNVKKQYEDLKRLFDEKLEEQTKLMEEKDNLENQILRIREDARKGLLSLEPKIREKYQKQYTEREAELKQEFAQKIEELAYSNNGLKEIQLELFIKENFLQKITEELEATRNDLAEKTSDYNKLEKNYLDLMEDCTQLRSVVSTLEKEKASFGNYDDKIVRLEAHINTLQEELKHVNEMCAKKEAKIIDLSQENLKLQQNLKEVNEKHKLLEEKFVTQEVEATQMKMMEIKQRKLEEENAALSSEIEMERKMYNEMLENHNELKEKVQEIAILKNSVNAYREEIEYLKQLLEEEREKNVVLDKKNLKYEKQITKLEEKVRILEEKEEAVNLDKTESGLLALKVQKLEEENKKLLDSFEAERGSFVKELRTIKSQISVPDETDTVDTKDTADVIKEIKRLNELKEQEVRDLAKMNGDLQKEINEYRQKIRLLEENIVTVEVEKTECNLLEIKVKKLEEDKEKLISEFEVERRMFSELLNNNKNLEQKEALIEELDNKLIEVQNELSEIKEMLDAEKNENIRLQKEKLKLEKTIVKLEEKIRVLNEREEAISVEKTECDLLEIKLQKLEEENKNLLDTFEAERAEFNKFYHQNVKNDEKIKTLVEENFQLTEDVKAVSERFENLLAEHQNLKAHFGEKVDILSEENKQLEQRLKEAENEIGKLIDSNNNYKTELQKKNEQIDELALKTSNLSETIQKQSIEFNDLLERAKKFDEVLETNQKQNAEMLKQEVAKQTELLKEVETLREEIELKNKQIIEVNDKLEKVKNEYLEHQVCLEKLQEIESLKKKIIELEHSAKNHQEEKESLNTTLENNNMKTQEEKSSLESKLKQLEGVVREKSTQIEIMKQEKNLLLEEREALHNDILNLRVEIDRLNADLNNLRTVSAQAEEFDKISNRLLSENQSLKSQIEAAQTEISELNVRVQQMTSDNRNILEESQIILNEKEELKLRLEALEYERSSDGAVKEELVEKNKMLTSQLEDMRRQLNEMQEQNVALLKEKNAINANESDIMKIQQDFYDIKEKCDNLVVENKNFKIEYSKLEEQCNDFTKIKQKLEAQIRDLEEQYTEIIHEKQLLQDEVQELKISPLNYTQNNHVPSKLDQLNILRNEALLSDVQNKNEPYLKEIEELRDTLSKYKSLDLTNKSSIEFYEHELDKLKNQNDKLNRKLDETLVTLNHCAELSTSTTEIEYLKNVLYNYMLGKESMILARVIAAVCKFDPQQTEIVMQREQQKQTLLGQLGFI